MQLFHSFWVLADFSIGDISSFAVSHQLSKKGGKKRRKAFCLEENLVCSAGAFPVKLLSQGPESCWSSHGCSCALCTPGSEMLSWVQITWLCCATCAGVMRVDSQRPCPANLPHAPKSPQKRQKKRSIARNMFSTYFVWWCLSSQENPLWLDFATVLAVGNE